MINIEDTKNMSDMKDKECIVEPITKIEFPPLLIDGNKVVICVGCGVRTKFYMNVYAVGTYIDKTIIQESNIITATCKDSIQNALCNPSILPRIIRIVTYWNIPMYLVTKGITDAIRPRLKKVISNHEEMTMLENQLHSLLNNTSDDHHGDNEEDRNDLSSGSEFILIVKGDTMFYSRGRGCINDNYVIQLNNQMKIQHQELCNALCDVYYGDSAVSIDHKESVIDGMIKLVM